MDPLSIQAHIRQTADQIHPQNVQFDTTYLLIATAFAGIFVAILVYFLMSQTKKPVPRDFMSQPSTSSSQTSRTTRVQHSSEDGDTDEDSDAILDRIAEENKVKKKMGVKKAAKLAAKAEKRAAREVMLREREEKKREQEYLDHLRKQEEEKEKEEEEKRKELERIAKEEQARKEHEAYLEMAANFEVEEEGLDNEGEGDSEDMLNKFINYINEQKVVMLEQLAAQFKMKTKDVVDRIQNLIANGSLVGIIDDRGKFISITNDELQSVSKFIRQRGRVTVDELVVNSNKLINLKPAVRT